MRYPQAIELLFGLQKYGIKLGLENITRLLSALGNPHASLNCIHVAGSNGKGSTCAYLQSIFMRAGYRAGLYTSPHLSDFTERIRIGGVPISKRVVAELVARIGMICDRESIPATFFEFATAMALHYFRIRGADPVIVETGMGGTFDATNCITPIASAITTISLDHQAYLGSTLSAIAAEKAGIIKPGIPVFCGARNTTARRIIGKKCHDSGSDLFFLGSDFSTRKRSGGGFDFTGTSAVIRGIKLPLAGDHQRDNAALALAVASHLDGAGYELGISALRNGIESARWPGRCELLATGPAVLADGAHNPEGARALAGAIETLYPGKRRILVLGFMRDKDIRAMLRILTRGAYATIVCRPEIDRSAGRDVLENFISFSSEKKVFWYEKSTEALAKALRLANADDLVCIAGSLYLVGELREIILNKRFKNSGRISL